MSSFDQQHPSASSRSQTGARGFVPGSVLEGDFTPAGSKSMAQRAILMATLARGLTTIEGLPLGADVASALRCARAAGARFPSDGRADDRLATALMARGSVGRIEGCPPIASERARPWATFDVGESGTTARFVLALAGLGRPPESGAEIAPSGTLARRQSPALFDALRRAGVRIESTPADASGAAPQNGFKASIVAAAPPTGMELLHPESSQEVSALLIALASHGSPLMSGTVKITPGGHGGTPESQSGEGRELHVTGAIPSAGYVDLTIEMLKRFGATVTTQTFAADVEERAGTRFTVQGRLMAPDNPLIVEPDASSAAVALAAAAITGGRIEIRSLGDGSMQPDASAAVRALSAFGCDTSASTSDRLSARGHVSRGAHFDCSGSPDLAPVLAVVAACAARREGATSMLTGLETLPGKESSRIDVLRSGLTAIGLSVDATSSSLHIAPGERSAARDVVLDPQGDHRMAFAFALLSLFEPGVRVSNPGCTAKSWPTFWADMSALGAAESTSS